jgi:acetoin utilization deacetylase AcuC-like enzyme
VTVYYSDDYVRAGHAFDTTRKARWVADSLRDRPVPGVVIEAPAPLTLADILAVHDPAYVEAVRTGEPPSLAESSNLPWDPDLWSMVCASNGGAAAAAILALETRGVAGSLSSGLHHAKRARGDGFCTFNGLAIAARRALDGGARGVLVIDLDAHCGGGTAALLSGDPRVHQLDIAVSAFDHYAGLDRFTLDVILDAADYLPTLRRRLAALDPAAFDLVVYNAGVDPFERCPIGGRTGVTGELLAEREDTVFTWCMEQALPVAFVLAGGYVGSGFSEEELVDLHRLTIEAAARLPGPSRRHA